MPKFSNSTLTGAFVCALLILSGTGCGNYGTALSRSVSSASYAPNAGGYVNSYSNGQTPNDPNYVCPPASQSKVEGTADAYQVCVNAYDTGAISIHGVPSQGNSEVYVFLVEATSDTQFTLVYDTLANLSTSGLTHIEASGLRFNAAFIVQPSDAGAMYTCLVYGENCTRSYAYSRFAAFAP